MLQAYVAAGLGFTLLPDLARPAARDLVVLADHRKAPKRQVWAATCAKGARSATEMVEVLREAGDRFADSAPHWPPTYRDVATRHAAVV